MRELLTQDGHRGADALEDGGGEGGADGQAVDEVVQAVAERDHPGQRADVRVGRPLQPVAAAAAAPRPCRAVWALGVLQEQSQVNHEREQLDNNTCSSPPPSVPSYLWRLCGAEHELALAGVHLAQSQTAGLSVLLQLLLLALLQIPVGCRVSVGTGVVTVAVALETVGKQISVIQ